MNNEEVLVLDKETLNQMIADSHKYIYNLVFDGEYTPEKFMSETGKLNKDEIFSVYKPLDMQTDLETVIQGYGYCGKEFIKNMIDKDKDSAYHVFESVVQDWLDLQEFLRNVTEKLEDENSKLKAMKESLDKQED